MSSIILMGFPGSSVGKGSDCSAGDTSSITVLGSSPGEGIGYPLQYSWASLMAHTIKNPPAMWEKGKIYPLEEEKERYIHLNAQLQRIARRDKITFLSDQ